MKKLFTKFLSALIAFSMLITFLPAVTFASGGNTYYVSTDGVDMDSAGTQSNPFKSITYAVSKMTDGDTLMVMPGTYHESLTINGLNNITICAQDPDNHPVITGADLVPASSWQKHEGNIWKAQVSTSFSNGDRDIVFQDDTLCIEARWPNLTETSSDGVHPLLNRQNYARVDQGGTESPAISDADLSALSGKNLVGAYVWCPGGYAYWAYVSEITSFEGNTIGLNNYVEEDVTVFDGGAYWPCGADQTIGGHKNTIANIYYIFGAYDLLDTNGEWYRDGNTLYFYSDGSDAPEGVELRTRRNTATVENAVGVVFDGIDFRAGLVELSATTSGCTIKNSVMQTLDYWMPKAGATDQNKRPGAYGAKIAGTNNLICTSEIKNMFGEGITLSGSQNRVLNNYIHDINFEATYSDGVYLKGTQHLVSHNTIEHLGRSSIGGSFTKSVISYNDISDGCKLTRDGGLVYVSNKNFENTEFHHNVFRNSTDNEGIQRGLYFDSFTSDMVVYRNLFYDLERADDTLYTSCLMLNYYNRGVLYFNNTVINKNYLGGTRVDSDRAQSMFVNNVFTSQYYDPSYWGNVEKSHNLVSSDCVEDDYTLKSTATAAIDQGIVIPGVTDDCTDGKPDLGAFEYGKEKWVAGHDFDEPDYENEKFILNDQIPYRNVIKNGDFEVTNADGSIDGWNTEGNVSRFKSPAWANKAENMGRYSRSGSHSIQLDANASATQTITGLLPGTAYEVGTYGMIGQIEDGEYTFDSSLADGDYLEMTAVSDTGEMASVSFAGGDKMPNEMGMVTVTTGIAGTITVKLTKKGGTLLGFADEVHVHQAFSESAVSTGGAVLRNLVVKSEGKVAYGVRKGMMHTIEGSIENKSVTSGDIDVSVTAYDGLGNVYGNPITDTIHVDAGKSKDISVDIQAPLSDGAYFELMLTDSLGATTRYLISDLTMNNIYNGTEPVFVKDFSVRNSAGQLISAPVGGAMNIFEVYVYNLSENNIPITGILAVYDGNTLVDIMSYTGNIAANDEDKFYLGTVLPQGENISVKAFAWNNMSDGRPIIEAQEMRK